MGGTPRGLHPSGGQSPLCSSKPAAIPALPALLPNTAVRSQPLLIYIPHFWWHQHPSCISESPEETTQPLCPLQAHFSIDHILCIVVCHQCPGRAALCSRCSPAPCMLLWVQLHCVGRVGPPNLAVLQHKVPSPELRCIAAPVQALQLSVAERAGMEKAGGGKFSCTNYHISAPFSEIQIYDLILQHVSLET